MHPAQVSSRVVSCTEDSGATWTARYEWQAGKGTIGPQLHLESVGGGAGADSGALWTAHWTSAEGTPHEVSAGSTDMLRLRIDSTLATLLAPDHQCSLILTTEAPHRPVAVIGDSVFGHIQSGWEARGPVDGWTIAAESGFGWSASSPTWPLTTVRGSWAIGLLRGLAGLSPSCVVVELGANDALRLAFADAGHNSRLASAIRSAVAANIRQLVSAAEQRGLPLVLVTAPTYPTSAFGAKANYQREMTQLNRVIRAAVPRRRAAIADWAEVSASHHGSSASPQNWFIADQLHPNPTGETALVALIQQAITKATRS